MKTYRHSLQVHLVAAGLTIFMGWMAYRCSVEHFVRGGMLLRVCLVAACVMLSVFSIWLYGKTGLNCFRVADSGLMVTRLWARRLIPWGEIDEMVWNRPLHLVFIKGKGRTLVFTSTDMFEDLPDLMDEISRRSQCKLSPNLEGVLNS